MECLSGCVFSKQARPSRIDWHLWAGLKASTRYSHRSGLASATNEVASTTAFALHNRIVITDVRCQDTGAYKTLSSPSDRHSAKWTFRLSQNGRVIMLSATSSLPSQWQLHNHIIIIIKYWDTIKLCCKQTSSSGFDDTCSPIRDGRSYSRWTRERTRNDNNNELL